MGAFDNFICDDSGQHRETHTAQRYAFGTKLITQDGREFRYALNGAVALAAGVVVQAAAPNVTKAVAVAAAIGDRAVIVTIAAIAVNDFADGYLSVAVTPGQGHLFRIDSNTATDTPSSGNIQVNLAAGGLKVALTTSSKVTLVKNPYKSVVVHPSPATALIVGVAPVAVAIGAYFWCQVKGPCAVLTEGTVVINRGVIDSATADGAVAPSVLTEGTPNTGYGQRFIGYVMAVEATTTHSLICLALDD